MSVAMADYCCFVEPECLACDLGDARKFFLG